MMCIGREDRDERKRLLLADLSRWAWQGVIEVPVEGTLADKKTNKKRITLKDHPSCAQAASYPRHSGRRPPSL